MTNRTYFGESHKQYSEACLKAVERMAKHPLTEEQFMAQELTNHGLAPERPEGK